MWIALRSGLVLASILSLNAVVLAQDRTTTQHKEWGSPTDPDGDCQIRPDGERLSITVPGTRHDLSAESGVLNAPRVLRPIEGDFIAQVKVSGNVLHAGRTTSGYYRAYHGAGLLLWLDRGNYVRMERAALADEQGKQVHYANFELRKDGKLVRSRVPSIVIPNRDTYLRVERHQGRILGSVSPDGVHWRAFDPLDVTWGKAAQLGVCSINTSTEKFKAEFVGFEVFRKEPR